MNFSGKESLLLCRSYSTRNRCNSYSWRNEIIAFWIVCISLCYLLHTQGNKLNENYSGQLKHLKIRKCQELRCLWSSVSLLQFIHYSRVLNYISTFFSREPMPHAAHGGRSVLFNASFYLQCSVCTSLSYVEHTNWLWDRIINFLMDLSVALITEVSVF